MEVRGGRGGKSAIHYPRYEQDPSTSDLHAWSIYRQNLNSDFTDSALGADGRSPLPYGNFHLREETVSSILRNPRLGPRSELGQVNANAYLQFGLPRIPEGQGSSGGGRNTRESDYTVNIPEQLHPHQERSRAKSETDLHHDININFTNHGLVPNRFRKSKDMDYNSGGGGGLTKTRSSQLRPAQSEGDIIRGVENEEHGRIPLIDLRRPHSSTSHYQFSMSKTKTKRGGISVGTTQLPNLQVRSLSTSSKDGYALEDLNFNVNSGEMLAILTTNQNEGTLLFEVLSGKHSYSNGEFFCNGNTISAQRLGRRVGYVRKDTRLHPYLTVEETINFHRAFKKADSGSNTGGNKRKTSSSGIVRGILDEIGLYGIRKSTVSALTQSELLRLCLATRLSMEVQILLIDGITATMDIFDTFFLLSFLEEWSKSNPGLVLMTIHPPTYEIFETFTKILLVSCGRTLFCGPRVDMLPYFAFIDYPCPPFKNPSDYYVDLVTRDDLSPEALIESTQRIQSLAESWICRQEPQPDPGPIFPLPSPIKNGNTGFMSQIFLLWKYLGIRGGINYWNLLFITLISSILSIVIGGFYWDIRSHSPSHVNDAYDRIGLLISLVFLGSPVISLLLANAQDAQLPFITRDFEEGLYSKAPFMLAQILGELPVLLLIYVTFHLPALAMAGVKDTQSLLSIVGYLLLLIYFQQLALRTLIFAFGKSFGTTIGSILFLVGCWTSGYFLHQKESGVWIDWTRFLTPSAWLFPSIASIEFKNSTFEFCSNPIVGLRGNLLMRELSCGLGNGDAVLNHYELNTSNKTVPTFLPILVVTIGGILICHLLSLILLLSKRQRPKTSPPLSL